MYCQPIWHYCGVVLQQWLTVLRGGTTVRAASTAEVYDHADSTAQARVYNRGGRASDGEPRVAPPMVLRTCYEISSTVVRNCLEISGTEVGYFAARLYNTTTTQYTSAFYTGSGRPSWLPMQ